MKNLTIYVLIIAVFFVGCGGRVANPILVYMPGDEKRSCGSLQAEMAQIQSDIARMLPQSDKFGYNALCVVGGVLVIVPFFFMDLKDAEKIEIEALRRRYNRLSIIASEKDCEVIPAIVEIEAEKKAREAATASGSQ